MANKKQGPMMIVLVAAIAVALFFVVRELLPQKPAPPLTANWACLECGYEFVAPLPTPFDPVRCPRDRGEVAQVLYYQCGLCELRFEAYRLKVPELGKVFFQVPGGEWVRGMELPRIVCPGGCGDPEALRYSPPES